MKNIAFITDAEKISWLTIEGTQKEPRLLLRKVERIRFPADVETGKGLCSLISTLELLLETESPTKIALLQAVKSKFNNTSSIRVKAEATIQIAAANKNIPLELIQSATLAARKKKLDKADSSLEKLLNDGASFSPKETVDAAGAGLISLPDGQV